MQSVKVAAALLVLSLAITTSCTSHTDKLEKLSDINTEICACKDTVCADSAMDKFITFVKKEKGSFVPGKVADSYEGFAKAITHCAVNANVSAAKMQELMKVAEQS